MSVMAPIVEAQRCARRWAKLYASYEFLGGWREVVDDRAVDGHRGVVRLDPLGDVGSLAAAAVRRPQWPIIIRPRMK